MPTAYSLLMFHLVNHQEGPKVTAGSAKQQTRCRARPGRFPKVAQTIAAHPRASTGQVMATRPSLYSKAFSAWSLFGNREGEAPAEPHHLRAFAARQEPRPPFSARP